MINRPGKFYPYQHAAVLVVVLLCAVSASADPPTAIRTEPLAVAPGVTTEVLIRGLHLTDATDVWSSFTSDKTSSLELLHRKVEADVVPESVLAAGEQPDGTLIVEAEDYSRGQYGRSGRFIVNGNFLPNYVEYDFDIEAAGNYQLELNYASGEARPMKLLLNGQLLTSKAVSGKTGGFGDADSRWIAEAVLALRQGRNVLRLERPGGTPHIDMLALVPTERPATKLPSVTATDRTAPLRAKIDHACPVGIYALRLATASGITNPLLFMVDDLSTRFSSRDNHSPETAQAIDLPCAIEGVTESGKADYFRFNAVAGEWVSVEAVATRLGSRLDPVIRILDHTGELVFQDDAPALFGDCRVRIQLPTDGTCFVAIEDASQAGSSAHYYRLRVGDFPLLSGTLPAAINTDQFTGLRLVGDGSESLAAIGLPKPEALEQQTSLRLRVEAAIPAVETAAGDSSETPPRNSGSGFTRIFASDLPQFIGVDHPATEIVLPSGLSGVFGTADTTHQFSFTAKKADRLVLSDISRQIGGAAMLALAIRKESGEMLGGNRRAGTAGGTVSVTIPEDGKYLAEVSEITGRNGAEFLYYAELRHSAPDFELTLAADSVILPQNGYSIVKVTAKRQGYNGPITLHVAGPDGPLKVANEVIAEKKNETRLKIYIPENLRLGDVLPLLVSGKSHPAEADRIAEPVERVASTIDVIRKALPQTPHPPAELSSLLAAVVGPSTPEFFKLTLDDGSVFFPRYVGEVYFTVRVTERAKGFTDPVALRIEGLPEGFSASGGNQPVGRSENNEYRFQLNGPPNSDVGTTEFRIVGEASFQGQTKEVTLTKMPLQIIDPLIVTAKSVESVSPGNRTKVKVHTRRFVPRAGGEMKQITLQLSSAPDGVTLTAPAVIAAAQQDAQVEVQVAAKVKPGTYNLILNATTEVVGNKFTVSSSPFTFVIVKP